MSRNGHSRAEIIAKLLRAEILAKAGGGYAQIAEALGVSRATLNGWGKAYRDKATRARTPLSASVSARGDNLSELQQENLRLRRLVSELLLEKLKLEARRRPVRSIRIQ